MRTLILFLIVSIVGLSITNGQSIPKFSKNYIIKGRILLPYAEIDEPFTAYYDELANKSRIDYYNDLELTIQRADLGEFYKIAYWVPTTQNNDQKTERVCFNMESSPLVPVSIQTVLPDLINFQLINRENCMNLIIMDNNLRKLSKLINNNDICELWEYHVQLGYKNNKYQFLLKQNNNENVPIFYLMMGYDSLMGSHYDKYEIIYESYRNENHFNSSVFDVHKKYKCRSYPGPGHHHHHQHQSIILMNPMKEFIQNDYRHIDEHFNQFIDKHQKNYTNKNKNEFNYRKSIFLQNYRFIMSINRKNLSYKLSINHLADRTVNELNRIRGRLQTSDNEDKGGILFNKFNYNLSAIPEQWDWRLLGAVTPVKDQAICGSCWSFGSTGTIEGQYFVKTGRLLRLSQQQLIDCSWTENNNGCDGGEDFRTYNYIMKAGGIATEEDYGHYLGVDGKCHDHNVRKSVKIKGFYNVTVDDVDAMRAALYYHGPVTVAIDASLKTFSFYSNGIYYDPKCSSKNLDHQVLAVGYGKLNGEKYWLIKNSWSTYWGNDGYILINQKNNDCGVLSDATFPLIE